MFFYVLVSFALGRRMQRSIGGRQITRITHQSEKHFGIARNSQCRSSPTEILPPSNFFISIVIYQRFLKWSQIVLPVQFSPRSGLPSKPVLQVQSLICVLPGPLLPELAGQEVHCRAWPWKSLYVFCGQAAVNEKWMKVNPFTPKSDQFPLLLHKK